MNPATLYTLMVGMVILMVMITAWTLDRLAESQAREEILKAEIASLRHRRAVQQLEWRA